LLLDAMRSYEEAIKLQPEVEDYRLVYKRFLEGMGLLNDLCVFMKTKKPY
jgi:hypothetical protein